MSTNRLEMITEMLVKNPDDIFLNYAAALEYKKQKKIKKAIKIFKKIVEQDPKYLPTYYQLGKLLEEDGRTDEAVEVYITGKKLARIAQDVKAIGQLSEALMILGEGDGIAF